MKHEAIVKDTLGELYIELLRTILAEGKDTPIGRERASSAMTKEIMAMQLVLTNCRSNVPYHRMRVLNYRFMVAEFLWIIAGRDDVGSLTLYNSQVARYSDDGKTFAGAYGPRLEPQWDYLQKTLLLDHTSRQAVATIWTPNPGKTRDVPCTISLQLLIRDEKLHGIFSMRSSDAWLGIPYDMYSFSQIVNWMACELKVQPGSLIMNLGSSHLYERDYREAEALVKFGHEIVTLESTYFDSTNRCAAKSILEDDKWNPGNQHPWNFFAKILQCPGSGAALDLLKKGRL